LSGALPPQIRSSPAKGSDGAQRPVGGATIAGLISPACRSIQRRRAGGGGGHGGNVNGSGDTGNGGRDGNGGNRGIYGPRLPPYLLRQLPAHYRLRSSELPR